MSDTPKKQNSAVQNELSESEFQRNEDQSEETEERPDKRSTEGEAEAEAPRLQKRLEESEQAANAYKDQLLRLAAEFDNYRKRVEIDKAEFVKFSNERIIRDLLPILDDFERAISNGRKSSDYDSFLKGIELIHQKLYKMLEEKGLKPIESMGREFDVTYHDVLMQIQRDDVKPHTIVEEVERGYTLHGRVIKHAKVIVAAESKDGSEEDGKE